MASVPPWASRGPEENEVAPEGQFGGGRGVLEGGPLAQDIRRAVGERTGDQGNVVMAEFHEVIDGLRARRLEGRDEAGNAPQRHLLAQVNKRQAPLPERLHEAEIWPARAEDLGGHAIRIGGGWVFGICQVVDVDLEAAEMHVPIDIRQGPR